MDVSVIIVNWNTRDLLRGCLSSIFAGTTQIGVEVIVVDNASSDDSPRMVAAEFPGVRLIANAENRGFAAANNQGMRVARGKYVLLLNPDTVVLDRAIERVFAFADENPGIGCIGCQVLEAPNRIQQTCFRFPSPLNLLLSLSGLERAFPRSRFFGRYWMGDWDRRSQRDVDVVSGMFMFVRREVIEQVGLMDEDYFVYAEEADWCFRMRRAGWRCVFAPVGQILHLEGGGKSSRQASVRMFVQMQKSLLLFHRKNRGWLAWQGARLIFIAAMAQRYCIWRLGALLGRDAAAPRARCALGALRFHLTGALPAA